MAKFGNIEAAVQFRFPQDGNTCFSFDLTYEGDGSESTVAFERNLLDSIHWIAGRFRVSKEQAHTKLMDAVMEKVKSDYSKAAG